MVLRHIPHGARGVVVAASTLHAQVFRNEELDVVDIPSIPQRLEDAIAEAKGQDVLNSFLAEVVVDAVHLLLAEGPMDLGIQGQSRG